MRESDDDQHLLDCHKTYHKLVISNQYFDLNPFVIWSSKRHLLGSGVVGPRLCVELVNWWFLVESLAAVFGIATDAVVPATTVAVATTVARLAPFAMRKNSKKTTK